MSPAHILNEALYYDRTVQDWHRNELPSDWSAIDLDLMGTCRRCSEPLYLIEATTRTDKPVSMLRALAKRADLPAFVIVHDLEQVTGGRILWPAVAALQSEQMVRYFLATIRRNHARQSHPAALNREETA